MLLSFLSLTKLKEKKKKSQLFYVDHHKVLGDRFFFFSIFFKL